MVKYVTSLGYHCMAIVFHVQLLDPGEFQLLHLGNFVSALDSTAIASGV